MAVSTHTDFHQELSYAALRRAAESRAGPGLRRSPERRARSPLDGGRKPGSSREVPWLRHAPVRHERLERGGDLVRSRDAIERRPCHGFGDRDHHG